MTSLRLLGGPLPLGSRRALACVDKVNDALNAFLLGQAAGVMIGLSLLDMLIPNIEPYGLVTCLVYFTMGWVVVVLLARYTDGLDEYIDSMRGEVSDTDDEGGEGALPVHRESHMRASKNRAARNKKAKAAILTTLALALHNAPEGLAVGITSLQSSTNRKIVVAAAIALHNIPEGIACATAMFNASGRRYWSLMVSTMSGMVEPIFAVLSVVMFGPFLTLRLIDLSLVGVAGVMVTVSLKELIPQAVESSPRHAVIGIITGFIMIQIGLNFLH